MRGSAVVAQASRRARSVFCLVGAACALYVLTGCSTFRRELPTRTPVPTFTATPISVGAVAPAPVAQQPAPDSPTPVVTIEPTPTPVPPSPTPTPSPEATPTSAPTATATATPEPTLPPTPTAEPVWQFDLEDAEKHPTESLAPNVVRVFLYVYSADDFALEGYSLRVTHNGAALPVEQLSEGGLPGVTRGEPGPFTRFTNMNALFVEPQAGTWVIELIDETGNAIGPPATFELTAGEDTRELYVRYRRL